jgi:hypothetical protein
MVRNSAFIKRVHKKVVMESASEQGVAEKAIIRDK